MRHLSVGEFHSAFVTGSGELLSWGSGVDSQLGVEPTPDDQKDGRKLARPRPARAAVGLRVAAVSAGADHTVGSLCVAAGVVCVAAGVVLLPALMKEFVRS